MTESVHIDASLPELKEMFRQLIREEMPVKTFYNIAEAIEYLGCSRNTLLRYERIGTIRPELSASGKKFYHIDNLKKLRP